MKNYSREHLLVFILSIFTLTYAFGLYAYGQGGLEQFPAVIPLQMFIPGLVTLFVVMVYKEKPIKEILGLRMPKMKWLLYGSGLIFIIMVASFFVSSLFTTDYFLSLEAITVRLSRANIPLQVESPVLSIVFLILLNVFIGAIVNLPLMLGEEIGWRAFMTPRLLEYFGERGHLIAGAIWSLWHAVLIAQGFNYPDAPILGNIFFIAFCIPVGYVFYYLYQKSGSVFVPAIMHGIMNKTAGTFMDFFVDKDKVDPLFTSPVGLIGIALFSITALIIFQRDRMAKLPIITA